MRSIRSLALASATTFALVLTAVAPAAAAPTTAVVAAAEATPPPATTFVTPLKAKSYSVVSFYGARCIPLPGASTFHLGLDMAAPGGAPIFAIAAGVVVGTGDGTDAVAGYIKIRHDVGGVLYTSIYYHIWKSTTHVKVGDVVTAGQRISEVGTSGVSGGNHLHLEIWKGKPGSATSLDPQPFMKARGVDLYSGSKGVYASKAPATCTYYVSSPVNFRTGPSLAASVISVLPKGSVVVAVPGLKTDQFIPVKAGTRSGWVSASYVTPNKVAPDPAPTSPATASVTVKPATYKTTGALNFRKTPSLKGKIVLVIPKGANVGVIKGTKGDWRKITYKGKTGWVHKSFLKKR